MPLADVLARPWTDRCPDKRLRQSANRIGQSYEFSAIKLTKSQRMRAKLPLIVTSPQFRKLISILLIAFVCFVAIAIYSPLHKHQNGWCSLNNVESCQAEEAQAILPPPQLTIAGLAEPTYQLRACPFLAPARVPARAPPAANV